MKLPTSVKISSRHQIALPSTTRRLLNLQAGDRLLVDVQDGLIILSPVPASYTERLSELNQETWSGIDVEGYLHEEREAWTDSDSE